MYATEVLGQYVESSVSRSMPEDVIHHAKRAVIDWYASLFPGLSVAPVQQLLHALADDLGQGDARLPDGRAASPRVAALVYGTAAHAAEIDDSFRDAMYHPGAATIAAALAAGQAQRVNGAHFLRSVVLGYEVSTRIGVVMGRSHYRFWHNTGTVGTFGAAAASAGILRLTGGRAAHALATAATFTAGLQQAFRMDSMSKPLHAGRAAEAGLFAARLAAGGVTGSLDILDGDAGLGQAMSDGADFSGIGDTLGQEHHMTRLTFKNHIGCGHTFAAIDAVLALREKHRFSLEDIAQIEVGTYQTALDIACHETPKTANEARFSLRYVVACAMVHGSVRLAAYAAHRLEDPVTLALMARVTVRADPDIDAAFPGQRSAKVSILTKQGQRFAHFQPNRKGDPELPLTDQELEGKFLELAVPVLGQEPSQALLRQLWALEQQPCLPVVLVGEAA